MEIKYNINIWKTKYGHRKNIILNFINRCMNLKI